MTTATAPAVTAASAAQLLRIAGPTEAELRAFALHYWHESGAEFSDHEAFYRREWWKSLRVRATKSNWPK